MEEKHRRKNRKSSIGYFGVSFLVLFLLLFSVLFFIEKQIRSVHFEEIKANEKRIVKLENDFLGKEFSMILADLHYLHHAFENQLESPVNYEDVALNWTSFSSQRNIYDQIRYIDASGDEQIRINLTVNGGYIVPSTELQNKKDRYYFYEALNLQEDSVHVSPLDLNIEHGEIEVPYKPMIRFSTPIFNSSGDLKGIIVLNYLAENVLSSFRELALNSGGEIVLLNSESYWLSSSDPNLEWNFMFNDSINHMFKNEYEQEWDAIINENGQVITSKGLFTFALVNLQHKIGLNDEISDPNVHLGDDGHWYIVSTVLRDGAYKSLFIDNTFALIVDVLKKNILYFLLIILVSSIVAFLIYLNRKTYSKIKYYSEYDVLTKVYNRRAGISRLNQLFPTDDRRHFLVSLCFIDVNGLKQVNDVLGHKFGDELIVSVVDAIKSTIRDQDFIIRLGGDEFLIVFNDIGVHSAEDIWDRIKAHYEKINLTESRPYFISVSHGIVSHRNNQKSQVDDLIKLADERMYQEKRVLKETLTVIR